MYEILPRAQVYLRTEQSVGQALLATSRSEPSCTSTELEVMRVYSVCGAGLWRYLTAFCDPTEYLSGRKSAYRRTPHPGTNA